jgi:hypothetical protein
VPSYPREELVEAFKNYYMVGIINEDWVAWSQLFTDDATYYDHFWGTFTGPAEIEKFLETTMGPCPHVYAALEWFNPDPESGRIVYRHQNRADHPIVGRDPIDFPSIQVIQYAGDGKFSAEEDWWVLSDMKRFVRQYNEALEEAGTPDFAATMSRRDYGTLHPWARPEPGHVAHPSWVGKDIKPVLFKRDIDYGVRVDPV